MMEDKIVGLKWWMGLRIEYLNSHQNGYWNQVSVIITKVVNVNEPGAYIVKCQWARSLHSEMADRAEGAVGGVIRSNGYYILMTWVSSIVCFMREKENGQGRAMKRNSTCREKDKGSIGKKVATTYEASGKQYLREEFLVSVWAKKKEEMFFYLVLSVQHNNFICVYIEI